MASALRNAPQPTSVTQLEAIAQFRDLFGAWQEQGVPGPLRQAQPVPQPPRVVPQQPPRVVTPIQQHKPSPPATPILLPTPRKLNFNNVLPPRVVPLHQNTVPAQCPPRSPIAHRTQSRRPEPLVGPKVTPLALNTKAGPYHHRVQYMIPTSKSVQPNDNYMDFGGLCQAMDKNNVESFASLCKALQDTEPPSANAVLDPFSGEFLEHLQLRWDP